MALKRTASDLSEFTSRLRGRDDVAIGAYARQQRRRQILIAAIGLGLVVAAVWIFMVLRPRDVGPVGGEYRFVLECVKCGNRTDATARTGSEDFPRVCERCSERACYPVWVCRQCGTQTVSWGRGELRCRSCGSRNMGLLEPPASATVP